MYPLLLALCIFDSLPVSEAWQECGVMNGVYEIMSFLVPGVMENVFRVCVCFP